jgi:hypothetical protein
MRKKDRPLAAHRYIQAVEAKEESIPGGPSKGPLHMKPLERQEQ